MRDFDNHFLIVGESNMLSQNLHTIFYQTEMKKTEYINLMDDDVLSTVANIFFDGDQKKAKNILEDKK